MSVFAKLFGKKAAAGRANFDLDPPPTPAFDPSIVRLVIFQERSSGRVPLFDSKAIERIDDVPPTTGKSNTEPRTRWSRGCRFSDAASSLPQPSPGPAPSSLDSPSRCKSLPVPKGVSGGQTMPMIATSGGVKYRLSKPPSDIKMLAEMAFGALPMKSDGVDLKIHEIRNPHQIMMSQVFNFTASASTHGSSGEKPPRGPSSSTCSQPSIPAARSLKTKGNSRFHLHLNALDASVDTPQHLRQSRLEDSLRRCEDYAVESAISPTSLTPSGGGGAGFGDSSIHGDLTSAIIKSNDGTPLHKSASTSLLYANDDGLDRGGEGGISMKSAATNLSGNDSTPMARSKPVDVPVFQLNYNDENPLLPSASLSSSAGSSSCVSSPSHPSSRSQSHRLHSFRQPVEHGSMEFNSMSSCGSAGNSSACSSVGSAFCGSYASVHKRWIRNQAKSLEFVGKSVGGMNGSAPSRRQNLETIFNGSSASSIGSRKEPTTKIAFSLVLDLESTALSSPSTENHQRAIAVLKTFLFTHASLIESHLRVLRGVIQSAVVGNKKDFIHEVSSALHDLRQRLNELITSPRLPHPLWLRLTTSSSSPFASSSTFEEQGLNNNNNLRKKSLCYAFLSKFTQAVDRLDTKHSNYFFSSLLTALLTRNLAWVSTVSPTFDAPSVANSSRYQYLQKRQAPWLADSTEWNAYNPLWGQLGDLFGAVTFPLKVCQTVVVGSKKEVVRDLLFILSYFIRCSDVLSADPASVTVDLWDQAINQLLLQESTISNRSGDTIVDVVPDFAGTGEKSNREDFDDGTIELSISPFDAQDDEDEEEDDLSPMFRPRSNTVLERKSVVIKKMDNCEKPSETTDCDPAAAGDVEETKSTVKTNELQGSISSDETCNASKSYASADSDESSPSRISRKDSGVLVDRDYHRLDGNGGVSLHDSGCYETLQSGIGDQEASRNFPEKERKETDSPPPSNQLVNGKGAETLAPSPPPPERKISSTLPLPHTPRSKTHSIDSQYSSKTSSTCQSDEGFDSIPSEGASKDGSPSSQQDGKKGLVDILDPSTFSGLNESRVTSAARNPSSKPSLLSSASASFDLDATDVPCIIIDESTFQILRDCVEDTSNNVGSDLSAEPIACNFGFSLLGNVYETFRPDFALQGTSDRDFVKTQLPLHLRRQLEHSFLDERVSTSCCIVADVDRGVVEVYSTENSDPTTPIQVTPANMVVGIAESLRDLFKVSSAASSGFATSCSSSSSPLSAAPELCLAYLEDKLQEIYFKSLTFSQLLPTLHQWNGKDSNELRSLVGFEMSDVPLLAAVASTHEENVQL